MLRWLCFHLDLKAKVLLEENSEVPTRTELDHGLRSQLDSDREMHERCCDLGVGVNDRTTLQEVVGLLFGELAVDWECQLQLAPL